VHGAVDFASGSASRRTRTFEAARGQLGQLDEPCAITFGREGRPLYVQRPCDDAVAILRTLQETIGGDGFAVAA
jgi:hypothetical protein